jgi:hypothetical protein
MRTSLYLIGFAAASIMGAGAVGFGCSSSSGGTTPPADSGTPEASTGEDGSTDSGGGGMDAEMEAASCTPAPVNIATFDGGAVWSCTQAACASTMGGLTACGADCTCNAAVFSALECVANDGGGTTACFTNALTPVISDMAVLAFATCLQSAPVTACASGGTKGDGGTDGGTDSGTDSGTDGGIADAGGGG